MKLISRKILKFPHCVLIRIFITQLFQDEIKFGPDGVCLVGGADQLEKLSFEPKFPIAPRPFSIGKLTVVLRMSSRIPVDHRIGK